MESGAFRGLRMALGMGSAVEEPAPSPPPSDGADASKRRTDSASSYGSGASSHRSGSHRRRRHHHEKEELKLPPDQHFMPVEPARQADAEDPDEEDGERSLDEMREEVICGIFDLPRSTTFHKDFSCAIAAAFPMHGRMYPTSTHVCFYSNVFGRERKILIPYESITELSKTTTLVFQGAIRIKTDSGEDYTFSSFWGTNRDRCFELIGQIRARVLGLNDESVSEAESSAASETTATDPSNAASTTTEEQRLRRTVSDGGIVAVARDMSMELLLEEQFPLSVDAFLATFIVDDAPFGFVQYNELIGTTEIQCHPWSKRSDDESLGSTRAMRFRVPIDSPIGPNSSMVDILQCHKTNIRGLNTIETSTRLVDIPYGDYFSVEDRWTIAPHPRDSGVCTLTIELKVVFSKSTFWKGQIESRAVADNKDKWIKWTEMAKHYLATKDDVHDSDANKDHSPLSTASLLPESAPTSQGSPPRSHGTPLHPSPCANKGHLTRRPTGVVVEPRAVDSLRDRSRPSSSSPRARKFVRRVPAQALPWVLVLVLLWIISRLNGTLSRMEQALLSTELRVVEIQQQIAKLHAGNSVCR